MYEFKPQWVKKIASRSSRERVGRGTGVEKGRDGDFTEMRWRDGRRGDGRSVGGVGRGNAEGIGGEGVRGGGKRLGMDEEGWGLWRLGGAVDWVGRWGRYGEIRPIGHEGGRRGRENDIISVAALGDGMTVGGGSLGWSVLEGGVQGVEKGGARRSECRERIGRRRGVVGLLGTGWGGSCLSLGHWTVRGGAERGRGLTPREGVWECGFFDAVWGVGSGGGGRESTEFDCRGGMGMSQSGPCRRGGREEMEVGYGGGNGRGVRLGYGWGEWEWSRRSGDVRDVRQGGGGESGGIGTGRALGTSRLREVNDAGTSVRRDIVLDNDWGAWSGGLVRGVLISVMFDQERRRMRYAYEQELPSEDGRGGLLEYRWGDGGTVGGGERDGWGVDGQGRGGARGDGERRELTRYGLGEICERVGSDEEGERSVGRRLEPLGCEIEGWGHGVGLWLWGRVGGGWGGDAE
ncbi:hypothetical protein Tco_0133754 [Tanacetum coccineum]